MADQFNLEAASLQKLAHRHRDWRARMARATALAAGRTARKVDLRDPLASFDSGPGRELELIVTAGQRGSAALSEHYVTAALAIQGLDASDNAGELIPASLAGVASDGRPLYSLLAQPFSGLGVLDSPAALRLAQSAMQAALARIVTTQVTDAGRVGDGVAIVSRHQVSEYVRVLMPPSCSRCALLAGRIYRSERAFPRHPRCDCIHVPVGDRRAADKLRTNPLAYFESLSKAQQDRIFTLAGAQAIRDGADISQVVNARRGMQPASSRAGGLLITTEGITRRGYAGRRTGPMAKLPGPPRRLMPEAIYQLASTREEARELLRRYGYI